jgi:hypothetical protein
LALTAGLSSSSGSSIRLAPCRRRQGLDEWLVNATTRRWRQLPDLATNVVLKFTSMNWTGDGRLVFWPRSRPRRRGRSVTPNHPGSVPKVDLLERKRWQRQLRGVVASLSSAGGA